MAEGNIELVVTRLPRLLSVTLKGPIVQAAEMMCPPHGEWLAIRFRLGTYLPGLATAALLDRHDLNLPVMPPKHFWCSGSTWEIPTYDNAEDFVTRLARANVITRDDTISGLIAGEEQSMSQRSVQRRFQRATGMTLGHFRMINRARYAAAMLSTGSTILDATYETGYFDQAHMTRSVKRLVGMTPARLISERPQLSFSYKTEQS